MASSAGNVRIAPVNVFWQIEAAETIDFTGILSTGLDGKFLNLSTAKDAILNYLWFDLDAVSADPAPVGRVAIEIDIITADSISTVATKAAAALDLLPGYISTATGAVVTIRRATVGATTNTVDVDTAALVTICQNGKDFDLGLLDGDVEKTFTPANFELQAHQSGVTVRSLLNQGIDTLEVTTSLEETLTANLKEIYQIYGGTFTPSAGTEVFGAGTSKVGANLLVDAARLVLDPVSATDNLGKCNLMLAIPVPDTLVFSGENPRTLSVTWQGFPDERIDPRVSALLFGEAFQAGLFT